MEIPASARVVFYGVHLPRDAGTWALIISIVGLFLIFPIGILVNMATPRLENWWSTRSVKTLKLRIEKLTRELARIESLPVLSEFEDRMLFDAILFKTFLKMICIAFLYTLLFLILILFFLTHSLPYKLPFPGIPFLELAAVLLLIVVSLAGLLLTRTSLLNDLYERRSSSYRKGIKAQIAGLSAKLAKYQGSHS
jgi:hypothetical protein